MATAVFNGTVVAESDTYEMVEGNVYFPPESIKSEFLTERNLNTRCAWKGIASYYSLEVDGMKATDVAWYYPEPSEPASRIKDYVAFYPQVEVKR